MMENKLSDRELLKQYGTDLESRKLWKLVKDIKKSDKTSELYCMKQTSINIGKCFELLEQGHSITDELAEIKDDVDNYWYNDEQDKSRVDTPITDLIGLLKQFKFRNYQEELVYFIKQNVDWRKKGRDFEIYKEIKEGKLYSELSNELDLTISAISKINKKVQSSINNLKGRFFEIKYEKYLKSLDIFRNCKEVRDGNPGKPDIYIIDNTKKEIYILSLKNLEINKKSFCITKDQIKPELEFAYYKKTFGDYEKVILYLIVFDSLTERLFVEKIDYKNPSNINI